ncbi:MAG: septum site-determining protein MinC [Syntrophomonadaceae bacterium]
MAVKIKGLNSSLVLTFDQTGFDKNYEYLLERISSNQQLFNGSKVVFQGPGLSTYSHEQLISLQKMCLEQGMVLQNIQETRPIKAEKNDRDVNIRRNVRSGQKIRSEGSVVVWGDVHESAEITAVEDIVVLGRLEGIAHAGCTGDMSSVVFALQLSPSQIRIGSRVSRAVERKQKTGYPEVAYWDSENICIKEYNARDKR